MPRSVATFVIWGVLAIFLPQILLQILLQHDFDNLLQSIAGILLCLQITLLFQEKDARVYGWLAVMSLLQAVVAARYSQGVAFGALLVAYSLVGMLAMSLLVLYSQWERHRGPVGDRAKSGRRQPVCGKMPAPSRCGRSIDIGEETEVRRRTRSP